MGACIGKPTLNKQVPLSVITNERNHLQRDGESKEPSWITHQLEENPQLSLKKQRQVQIEPQKSKIDSKNKVEINEQINSICTLDILLGEGQNKQNMNDNAWSQSYSTRSSIIRMPKKHNKKLTKQQENQEQCVNEEAFKKCMQNLSQNQNITAQAQDDQLFIKISFQADKDCSDIQFMLPKCRAGPLVVPYINFEKYLLE